MRDERTIKYVRRYDRLSCDMKARLGGGRENDGTVFERIRRSYRRTHKMGLIIIMTDLDISTFVQYTYLQRISSSYGKQHKDDYNFLVFLKLVENRRLKPFTRNSSKYFNFCLQTQRINRYFILLSCNMGKRAT